MRDIVDFIINNIVNLGILTSVITGLITYISKVRSDKKVEYLKSTLNGLSDKLPNVIDFFTSDLFDKKEFSVDEWKKYYTTIFTFGSRKTVYLLALLMQLMYAIDNKKIELFLRKEFKLINLYIKFKCLFYGTDYYNKCLDNVKTDLQFSIISLMAASLKNDFSNVKIISTSSLKCKITDFYQISTPVYLISINVNIKYLARLFF